MKPLPNKYLPNIGWVYDYDESDGSYEVPVGSIPDSFKDPSSVPLPQDHSNTATSSVPI